MKTFHAYLLEAKMSAQDAMKILGLSGGFSADDLKKAYRASSIANHPDRGGSTAKMQDVNVANDVLSQNVGAGGKYSTKAADNTAYWEDRKAKAMAYAHVATEQFDGVFRPIVFQQHFEKALNTTFTVTRNEGGTISEPMRTAMDYITRTIEWSNEDRTIVLYLYVTVSFAEMFRHTGVMLAATDSMFSTQIQTEILYNRKKIKLTQSNYTWAKTRDAFRNPNILFPAAKLSVKAKAASTKTLKKADVLLTFKRELNGHVVDGEWVYVPIADYVVTLHRMTFIGVGTWSCRGVYTKTKYGTGAELADIGYTTVYETWEHMTPLFNMLKQLQKDAPPAKVTADMLTKTMAVITKTPSGLEDKPLKRRW